MFRGSMVALVTPMTETGAVDIESLRQLVDWHIDNLTDAIVILGTTGESPTIDFQERESIIKHTLSQAAGRVPIIAGTGVNSTQETVRLTLHAMELGIDACLLVTPYYNKPTQEGLYQHYKRVAESVAIPQILYNVPTRTACDMLPQTVGRLSAIPNIVGIKEATTPARVNEILNACVGELDLYSGDDAMNYDFIVKGGKGAISVTANLVPRLVHDMCTATLDGNHELAKQLDARLMPLNKELFVESNPIPVKWALHLMGKISTGIRLPLTVLSENKRDGLLQVLRQTGVI